MKAKCATLRLNPLRRVGAAEGFWHIAVGAVALAALGAPFKEGVASFLPLAGAGFWSASYGLLRVTRRRGWFGAWDAISFGAVVGFAAVLGVMLVEVWPRV